MHQGLGLGKGFAKRAVLEVFSHTSLFKLAIIKMNMYMLLNIYPAYV
jgi:hypothetical protein